MSSKLIYHLCCGPCGILGLETLCAEGFDVICYFDGANIHPVEEYERRLASVRVVCESVGARLFVPPYDPTSWLQETLEFAQEPEGGQRCPVCFRYQLTVAARCGAELGAQFLCTSLTMSRQKSPQLINTIGEEVAHQFGLQWVERVWRKGGGLEKGARRAKELGLYRQSYCGCRYSMRRGEG